MTKLTTSALGLLLLNPTGCSGVAPGNDADSSVGGKGATGGSGGVVRCDIFTGAPCGAGQICKQTMFPIMPPQGFGGELGSNQLGECVAAGTGGQSGTGGVGSIGGTSNNGGGAKSVGGNPATGGTSARVACNTSSECLATDTCIQVIFPVLSPGGVAGGTSTMKLGECRPTKQSLNLRQHEFSSPETDDWWQTAEALLRRT